MERVSGTMSSGQTLRSADGAGEAGMAWSLAEERFVHASTQPVGGSARLCDWPPLEALDPGVVLRVARRHHVVPRAFRAIEQRTPVAADNGAWDEGIRIGRELSARALRRHLHTVSLLKALNAADIPVCPLKGTFLSHRLFGDPTVRQSSDIDLLVPADRVLDAARTLVECGYGLKSPRTLPAPADMGWVVRRYANYHIVLTSPRYPRVELHWRLTTFGRFPGEMSGALWDRLETDQISGVSFRQMNPTDLLLYLALHGTKHKWRLLSWLSDFTQLATNVPDAIATAAQQAARHDLTVVFATACTLADRWYGTTVGVKPRRFLHRRRVRYLSDHIGLQTHLRVTPGGVRRYDWNSHDRGIASLDHALRQYLTPTFTAMDAARADYRNTARQFRGRVWRKLQRVVTGGSLP